MRCEPPMAPYIQRSRLRAYAAIRVQWLEHCTYRWDEREGFNKCDDIFHLISIFTVFHSVGTSAEKDWAIHFATSPICP